MFICVFDVSRARGYIYNLVPRVLRLLYPFVSLFLISQRVTFKLSTSIVPKNKHVLFGTKMIALLLGSMVFCLYSKTSGTAANLLSEV
jgi:hypothetical protein